MWKNNEFPLSGFQTVQRSCDILVELEPISDTTKLQNSIEPEIGNSLLNLLSLGRHLAEHMPILGSWLNAQRIKAATDHPILNDKYPKQISSSFSDVLLLH